MAENSENIEARLCAYVEGDLDEQGRVEIERHLQAHPHHRRLLSELMATRELLRYLPREQAPAELSETFNAQLERSALLDGPGGESARRTLHGGNLLPRLMAMAAIVVLGSGLFAIVYFSLPRGESGTRLAMPNVSPESRPVTEGLISAGAERADTARDAFVTPGAGGGAGAAGARTERLGKGGAPLEGLAARSGKLGGPADSKDGTGSATFEKSGRKSAALAEPVYVLVSADRIDAAVREVTSNLSDNSIVWETVTDAAPLPPRLQQYQSTANTVKNNTAAVAQLELSNALQKKFQYQQQVPAPHYAKGGPSYAREREVETPATDAIANAEVAVGGHEAPAAAKPDATPTAVASAEDRNKEKAFDDAAAQDKAAKAIVPQDESDRALADGTEAQHEQKQQALQPAPQAAPAQPTDTEVIAINAYGVTRRQVEELGRVLNRSSQRVELIADDAHLQRANAGLQRMLGDQLNESEKTDFAVADQSFKEEAAPAASQPAVPETAVAQAPAVVSAPAPAPAAESGKGFSSKRPSGAVAVKGGTPLPSGAAPATGAATDVKSDAWADAAAAQRKDVNAKVASRAGAGPQAPLIRPGAKLYVTVDELKGPGTEATTEARVADDGTIELPQLPEPLRVDGLTRPQAEHAIAEAYRNARVIDSPTVTVEPVADDGPPINAANKMQQRRQREAGVAKKLEQPQDALAGAAEQPQQGAQQAATPPGPDAHTRLATTTPAERDSDLASQDARLGGQRASPPALNVDTIAGTQPQAPARGRSDTGIAADDADADDRLDVVILVQRNTAAPAGAAANAPGVSTSDEAEPESNPAPNAAASEPPDPAAAQRPESPDAPTEPAAPAESAK